MDRTVAQAIAEKCFGIQASAEELPSERDRNFLLTARDGEKFVLKIANVNEERMVIEAQNAMLSHLSERVLFCPRVLPALSGEMIEVVDDRLVRVLSYLPGKPLAKVEFQSPELLYDLGRKLGQLSRALVGFDHPSAHRAFYWDLLKGPEIIQKYGPEIKADWLRNLVLGFRERVGELRRSVVHGDANDYNVLVDKNEVVGLIDFGDIVYSYTVGDLAIAVAYVVLGKDDPYSAAAPVIEGYREEFELNKDELDALWPLVRLRLCMSVCIAAHQQQQQPENEYLGISQRLIEETLPKLFATDLHG
ncbi:MAG TPA: phosphotransferase [Pyrinomonadaceae bacterium]|nr:phosphotransferase [Pyrinomonadaceae bacterium]